MQLKTAIQMNKNDGGDYVKEADFNKFVDYVMENMATKDDLKGMATKDDLRGMATKEDILNIHAIMATKEDLKRMATKEDLDQLATSIRSNLMNAMDYIVNYVDGKRLEDSAQAFVNTRHEAWIKGLAQHTRYTLPADA